MLGRKWLKNVMKVQLKEVAKNVKKNIKLDDIKKKYFDKNHRDSTAAEK